MGDLSEGKAHHDDNVAAAALGTKNAERKTQNELRRRADSVLIPLAPGTRLGVYELQELLGQGGMGAVYRARDTRLDRTVAIKTLPYSVAGDADRLARFDREARLASSLNHPNIVVIHDIGEAAGTHFIAMEYVEGETLAATMASGAVSPAAAVDLARQIADALASAHGSGVIHRDLKPSNVMVMPDRRVKLLDFGLSKLVGQPLEAASTAFGVNATTPGTLIGTAAYMSPEQATGKTADARSDQFSFGIILYELVAGRHPFQRRSSVQTLSAIIEDDPEPLGSLNPRVPEALALVIERCLAKDPQQRFVASNDLALALNNISDHLRSGRTLAPVPRVRRPSRTRWLAGAAVAVAVSVSTLGWWWFSGPSLMPSTRHVAVLPLTVVNDTSDRRLQLLSNGLAEVLTTRLSELERFSGSLRIVPASEVRREQITSARDAQRAFGVNLVVTGSVQPVGEGLRLTLNVVDPATLRILTAEAADATVADMTLLQDEIVLRVARLLDVEVNPQARALLAAGGTTAPGAYEFYLQGRAYLQRYERRENIEAAIAVLERAVTADARFALAHAALAEAFWQQYEAVRDRGWVDKAKAAGATAIQLNPKLTQGRVTLAMIATGTGAYEQATEILNGVLAEDSTNADAYRELARAYEGVGDFEQAARTFQRAIRARPADAMLYNQLGAFYSRRRQFAEAAVQFGRVVALTPDNARGHSNLGAIYAELKRYDEAIVALERAVALNPASAAVANLGTVYFRQGRYADAVSAFERATKIRETDYRIWRNLGGAYQLSQGPSDKMRQAFTRAAALAENERRVNPRQPMLLAQLADCYAYLGQGERARLLMADAEGLAPKDGGLFLLSAQVYEYLGDRKQALAKLAVAKAAGVTREEIEMTRSLDALRRDPGYEAVAR